MNWQTRTLLLASLALNSLSLADDPQQRREKFFEERVRPLLFNRCYECHGSQKQESSLRLDSRAAILSGGDAGPAAVVRNLDESLIIQAVRGEIEPMPPKEPLDETEIAILERWVTMGLPWAAGDAPPAPSLGDQVAIKQLAASHWAFQPIRLPVLPAHNDDKSMSSIDVFINQRVAAANLTATRPSDRRTLLRRLSFDLIGLPPTAQEVAAFVTDTDENAIENVVQRLLESPHYGERWGRHWLDIARYADSQDWEAQADVRYPFAFTYRDWVIQAFNQDMPYDEFIRNQLAADFLVSKADSPQLAALGFLTVGPRFRNDKLEVTADQIDVVSRGLMGLTVACARCHDHKYDPVPTEDYYALYGVFASCSIPTELPEIAGPDIGEALIQDYRKQLAKAEQAMVDYRDQLRTEAMADLQQRVGLYFAGYYDMGLTKKSEIRGVISKLKVKETAMTPLDDRLVELLRKGDQTDPVMGPWIMGLTLPEAGFATQADSLIEQWTSESASFNSLVKAALRTSQPKTQKALIECYATVFQSVLDQSADDPASQAIRAALVGEGGLFDLDASRVLAASRLLGTGRRMIGDLEKGIGEVFATHPGAPPRAMVVKDAPSPINPFVMLRGEPNRRGERVDRRFISLLSQDRSAVFERGSGRLELADNIVAKSNPLTARVMVNRVWAQYFGNGLVENADDFGLRCPPPTHPELLDWLSASLMDNGWSLKWLHRTIVMSDAYQRSCETPAENLSADPENHLLTHQNRRRLDLEAMRDSMLATSGLLDTTIGGRSVKLSATPFTHRRTVYAYVDRVDMDPMLKTFDFASSTASASERPVTTIPQQALFLMNHPMVAEFARQMAKEARQGKSEESAIHSLYERFFQRPPTGDELALALEFISRPQPVQVASTGGWSNGYGQTDRTSGDFTPLAYWSGIAYQASDVFPDPVMRSVKLSAVGGNPMMRPDQAVIRRWTAPDAGSIRIEGDVAHTRDTGDGIVAQIVGPDGEPIWERKLFNESVDGAVESIAVTKGQTIEFLVHCFKNAAADSFRWAPKLLGTSGQLNDMKWSAESDFAGPLPPKLNAWEQMAQALMLTNEFHFLD